MVDARTSSLVVLVLDTNFLIDHLSFVQSLASIVESDPISLIVVPYQVIQELDKLKLYLTQATTAINFLVDAFKRKIIQGQQQDTTDHNHEKSMDDLILDVAIDWTKKAMTHSIKILSRPIIKPLDFFYQLKGLVKGLDHDDFELGKSNAYKITDHSMDIDTEDDSMVSESNSNLDGILSDLIILVETSLNPAFRICLEKSYGPDWTKYVKESPWTIKDLFAILLDHALIAFTSLSWSKLSCSRSKLRNMAKDLERSVRFHKTLVTIGDLKLFCKDLEIIFEILSILNLNYNEFKSNLSKIIESLMNL